MPDGSSSSALVTALEAKPPHNVDVFGCVLKELTSRVGKLVLLGLAESPLNQLATELAAIKGVRHAREQYIAAFNGAESTAMTTTITAGFLKLAFGRNDPLVM